MWLTALPLDKNGFALHKSAFRDAFCLRYGWLLNNLPTKCACGHGFTIDHALCCPKGAFPTYRHNELRDLTGSFLSEVCIDVQIEPELQPLEGRARGFWGTRHQDTFFDVKVFNPNASSNKKFTLSSCYNHNERIKKRSYEERINEIEGGSFTPIL